ncbi:MULTISPECIES: hypothetical protein [unclassified Pseudonocardia]|uniref:hypothetical protein n=1 Tax=unclassified Pseudonocardia TaxID=2619320 RepID=UPI0001FFDA59|nr:hypothetical protein [Pseudonocardia sp. Ae707_Ps1]OLM09090.1 hypothetical protein Ae707Ps1_6037 [Pseudonocardia sp. Ae707_Ps1]
MARAYEAFRAHHGRFVAAVSADMLPDLHRDVAERDARIVFLGRDGHSYAAAVRGLDPDFYERYCTEIVLSRAVVEAALADLEHNAGARFDAVESFRVRDRVDPTAAAGAFQALSDYLDDAAIPTTDGAITLVDNSFKGTIQELYSAAYPGVEVHGRYAIHAAHPDDPHPGTKTGYALHQPARGRWGGYPLAELPDEPELTLGAAEAVAAIEHTLHGPDTSPTELAEDGPVQQPQRFQTAALRGYNPALIEPAYREPRVREAVKVTALLAVHDTATQARPHWTGEQFHTTQHERHQAVNGFATHVRAWITQAPDRDAALTGVLDAFVRRSDRALLAEAYDQLAGAGLDPTEPSQHWTALATATPQDKQQIRRDLASGYCTAITTQQGPRREAGDLDAAMERLRNAVETSRRNRATSTDEPARTSVRHHDTARGYGIDPQLDQHPQTRQRGADQPDYDSRY